MKLKFQIAKYGWIPADGVLENWLGRDWNPLSYCQCSFLDKKWKWNSKRDRTEVQISADDVLEDWLDPDWDSLSNCQCSFLSKKWKWNSMSEITPSQTASAAFWIESESEILNSLRSNHFSLEPPKKEMYLCDQYTTQLSNCRQMLSLKVKHKNIFQQLNVTPFTQIPSMQLLRTLTYMREEKFADTSFTNQNTLYH